MAGNKSIKERIIFALEKANRSKSDLARHLGLSRQAVNSYFTKDDFDSIKYVLAVAELTGQSVTWLLGKDKTINMVDEDSAMYINPLKHMPEEREDATNMAAGLAVEHYKQKYEELVKRYELLEGALEDNRRLAELLTSNNEQLKEKNRQLESEVGKLKKQLQNQNTRK